MWFEIKTDSLIVSGPYHKLKEIQLVREVKGKDEGSRRVKELAKKFIEKGAWHANSEHLLALLSTVVRKNPIGGLQ